MVETCVSGWREQLCGTIDLQFSHDSILVLDKANNLLTPSQEYFILGLMLRVQTFLLSRQLTESLYSRNKKREDNNKKGLIIIHLDDRSVVYDYEQHNCQVSSH